MPELHVLVNPEAKYSPSDVLPRGPWLIDATFGGRERYVSGPAAAARARP